MFHNYIRKNVSDKTTPSEKCGIEIDNPNKWEGLLLKGLEDGKEISCV